MKAARSRQKQDAIEQAAATWVARHDAGLGKQDAVEFEAWLADPAHARAWARFSKTWAVLARPRRTGTVEEIDRELGALQKRRRRRMAAAVSTLTAVALSGLLWLAPWKPDTGQLESGRAVVILPQSQTLPDSTRVVSPKDGKFTVDFSGPMRRVRLQSGTALFTVAKDPGRPFIVEAGGVEFRAVGTAFAVQLKDDKVVLTVTEGKVAVEQSLPAAPVTLAAALPLADAQRVALVEAGNELVVERSLPVTESRIVAISEREMASRLAWMNPSVEFSDAPLSEVVALVNRYNQVQFVIGDRVLEETALSGLFRADDPDALQRMLEAGFGIKSRREGNRIILLRTGGAR